MPVALPNGRALQLLDWIRAREGVAHSATVRAEGFSASEIASAVHRGELNRVRRSWLLTPECDARRVAAARVGGRATCVTAAALRGLWVPAGTEIHVAVPGTSSRLDHAGLRLHWGTGPAPIARNATEDPILNVLFHVAHCLAPGDALAVWESAIRRGITESAILARVAWRSTDAAALASAASILSDSGLETHFIRGMRRARVVVRQQVWIDGHPVDGLIGDSLVVQIDGFEHHRAADRRRDIEADARLTLLGFALFRFDYVQVLFGWDQVLETVTTAMAQGLHRRPTTGNRRFGSNRA